MNETLTYVTSRPKSNTGVGTPGALCDRCGSPMKLRHSTPRESLPLHPQRIEERRAGWN